MDKHFLTNELRRWKFKRTKPLPTPRPGRRDYNLQIARYATKRALIYACSALVDKSDEFYSYSQAEYARDALIAAIAAYERYFRKAGDE